MSRTCLFYNSALRCRTINPERKQTGFLKWFFNMLLFLLVKILAPYRLSLVELLCRIHCCYIHVLKPRIVYHRSGMEKVGRASCHQKAAFHLSLLPLFFIDTCSSITNTFHMLWISIGRCNFLTCCIDRNNITFQFFKWLDGSSFFLCWSKLVWKKAQSLGYSLTKRCN